MESLPTQTNEIIVVDNGSVDGTREMLSVQFPEVRTIFNSSNLGFGAANNQGMRIAHGRFIVLLNSDTLASPETIERCARYVLSHPEVGILGCRLSRPTGDTQCSWGDFFSLRHAFIGGFWPQRLRLRVARNSDRLRSAMRFLSAKPQIDALSVDWVSGAFMLLRKEVFADTGGFDENIFLYGEEIEWCFRAKEKGWKIVYYPGAEIVHVGQGSISSVDCLKRNRLIMLGVHYFLMKHRGKAFASWFWGFAFVAALAKIPRVVVPLYRRETASSLGRKD